MRRQEASDPPHRHPLLPAGRCLSHHGMALSRRLWSDTGRPKSTQPATAGRCVPHRPLPTVRRMKRFLEVAGFLMAVEGIAGIVRHFVGWFRLWTFIYDVGFLRGRQVLASVGLV